MQAVHDSQLRPELLFRHALPYWVTEDAYFPRDPSAPEPLTALLAGHTLALTHLDYHLDGSSPDPNAAATAVKLDAGTAVAYAVRMIYGAGAIAGKDAGRVFADVFNPVSSFVTLRMHEDWLERYSRKYLKGMPTRLNTYLTTDESRLMASGYWEVMVRGAFAAHTGTPASDMMAIVRNLRRLRQLVDEIADFADDLRAGLVTAPTLFAATNGDATKLEQTIDSFWTTQRPDRSPASSERLDDIVRLVDQDGGFEAAYTYADEMWHASVQLCESLPVPKDGILALLDLKRAKLEMLRENGWVGQATGHVLPVSAEIGV
jgi:hypothetical protein